MRLLVTGGGGFVGKRFIKSLLDKYGTEENEIVCILDPSEAFLPDIFNNSRLIRAEADIRNIESIDPLFRGVDCVFHLAALVQFGNFNAGDFYSTNVDGSENIFKLAGKHKVTRVVYLSSASVFPPPYDVPATEEMEPGTGHRTRYAQSKRLGYLKAREYIRAGVPIIPLLPVMVYGEGAPFFRPLLKLAKWCPLIPLPKAEYRFSMLYVGDLADSIIKAFEVGLVGRSYIISGKDISLREMTERVVSEFHKKYLIMELPRWLCNSVASISDFISCILGRKPLINVEFLNFISTGLLGCGERAVTELGHKESDLDVFFPKMIRGIIVALSLGLFT